MAREETPGEVVDDDDVANRQYGTELKVQPRQAIER